MRFEKDASIAANGALVAYFRREDGPLPKDKADGETPRSEKDVWWGR